MKKRAEVFIPVSKMASGFKIKIGTGLCRDISYDILLEKSSIAIDGFILPDDNELRAVYYNDLEGDSDSGYLYFKFDRPVSKKRLKIFFNDSEIIDVL